MHRLIGRLLGLALAAGSLPLAAQIFGPAGGQFTVNTTTTGAQIHPSVAVDRLFGGFFVVWQGPGADGDAIFGRRYTHEGVALDGTNFRINATTTGGHVLPSAAPGSAGDYVVVWERDATGPLANDVYGQRYDPSGETGGVFQINTSPFATSPRVASDASLNFVTVYANLDIGEILAQRYDSAGAAQGGEFRVDQATPGTANYPSVARATTGDFVFAYEAGGDIFARRYSAAGAPLTPEFQVSVLTGGGHHRPRVAASQMGFVVTWHHKVSGDTNIKARLYGPAGAPVTGEFRVNTYTAAYQSLPDAGMDSSGNFVVVWTDYSGHLGFSLDLLAQRYDSTGSPLAGEFRVNTATAELQRDASIAMQANGDFVVAWTDYHSSSGNIRAQRYCHALTGDVNDDGAIDVADVFYLINSLFAGGPAPPPGSGDVNGDGTTDVSDVFFLVNYLFAGGPPTACTQPQF